MRRLLKKSYNEVAQKQEVREACQTRTGAYIWVSEAHSLVQRQRNSQLFSNRIDLHMHSIYSDDGEYEPKALVDLCLANNVSHFAITDHNSVKAIQEAFDYCADKTIQLIPGIELDCTFEGVNLHVLGYGIDHTRPIYEKIEADIIHQEQSASLIRMDKVRALGIPFSDALIETLSRHGVVSGEAIAEAALAYDFEETNPLLDPYRSSGSRSDNPFVNFYWDFCAQGKPAYAKVEFMTLNEAIKVIENSGGVPILAHPGNNTKENIPLLEGIIACGIKGLEVYSSYHSKEQVLFYKTLADKHSLLVTSGSDFHGKTKPSIQIGSTDCEGNESVILTALISSGSFGASVKVVERQPCCPCGQQFDLWKAGRVDR